MSEGRPDPRLHVYRQDLAADSLRGRVDVPRYVEGTVRQVVAGVVPLRKEPRHDAPLETELLFGETVTVYEEREGWAWAQADGDSYVGYAAAEALSPAVNRTTHRVASLRTFLYPAPDIKAPPLDMVSMNALVSVQAENGRFSQLAGGQFVTSAHVAPLGAAESDFVDVAERFLGTPYLWGGRTSIGVDCSGLIQLSLHAAGIECPRDTDMQEARLGQPLPDPRDQSSFQRGDLIFWKGHMGVMIDDDRLLHANAHHMAVAIEPVGEAIARIAANEGPVTSVRRLAVRGSP